MLQTVQKIIVMSDIHLTNNGEKIIGLDPVKKLSQALEHALYNHADASHIVFTGDLTHDGNLETYLILKELTRCIRIPITYMMGNHDRRKSFSQAFSSIPLDENGFLQSSVTSESHKLLFLDTLNFPYSQIDRSKGYLCHKRLNWLEKQLELAEEKEVILFMHHPAFTVGFKAMDRIRLMNCDQFFSVLDKYKNVIHIISGHIHRTISGNARGYGFSIFKSTCHQMPMNFNSENVKLSAVEPATYGILLLDTGSVIVHTEDYELDQTNKENFV